MFVKGMKIEKTGVHYTPFPIISNGLRVNWGRLAEFLDNRVKASTIKRFYNEVRVLLMRQKIYRKLFKLRVLDPSVDLGLFYLQPLRHMGH